MRETKTLEFKEAISNSFLKTVSAYANNGGGTILFGVNDEGNIVGLADPIQACLDIENKINDSISPQPIYTLDVREKDGVVELVVQPGRAKPYVYRSKAYKRNDSSTIEVDRSEFTRLVLEGRNLSFDELPAKSQDLTFSVLGEWVASAMGVSHFGMDTLKTLGLYSDADGYNTAAEILADKNGLPGIDMMRFGESINIIERRETFAGESLLSVYNNAVRVFRECYCYEKVSGALRIQVERIPVEAFREAVANALAHRMWDVPAHVRVAMYDDRVEVTSPGGLPAGMTEREYLAGFISIRRNPILANVLLRLRIIEAFGTGILRIGESYKKSPNKPRFEVTESAVTVVLPVMKEDLGLTGDQQQVYDLLSKTRPMATGELEGQVAFGKTKLRGILAELRGLGVVETEGSGRGLKYRRAR